MILFVNNAFETFEDIFQEAGTVGGRIVPFSFSKPFLTVFNNKLLIFQLWEERTIRLLVVVLKSLYDET